MSQANKDGFTPNYMQVSSMNHLNYHIHEMKLRTMLLALPWHLDQEESSNRPNPSANSIQVLKDISSYVVAPETRIRQCLTDLDKW